MSIQDTPVNYWHHNVDNIDSILADSYLFKPLRIALNGQESR